MTRSSIMSQLYTLLKKTKISRKEAAEQLGVTRFLIDTYFWCLCDKGIIEINTTVNVFEVGKDIEMPYTHKQDIYKTMVEIYLEDFKVQKRFLESVVVGHGIRLLLERM